MINPTFNSDFNFSNSDINISEVNTLYMNKKRQIEKELTKYDVDSDTKAKALKV